MIEKLIKAISPKWAASRARYRVQANAYEAAKSTRTRRLIGKSVTANEATQQSAIVLRNEARHLERNHDLARGALDVLVANTVGLGIRPEPQVRKPNGELATEVNDQLQELWQDWAARPEVTWQLDLYAMQRIAARSWLRDGEVFSQMLTGRMRLLDHGTRVPFSVEMIEADMVPYDVNEDGVLQGIAVNSWGRPVAYWIHKYMPTGVSYRNDFKRIPADNMVHLALRDRIRQMRGVSVFASVLTRLSDIKDIEESERVAARVAAAMSAYIKKGDPSSYGVGVESGEYREIGLEPGIIFDDLLPGEEVGTIGSNRPNNELIPFRQSQLRAAAAGLGASYSSLSKDYNGTYSAQRQELVEQRMHYGVLHSQFISQFHKPIYERFVDAALLMMPTVDIDDNTKYNASHSRPVMPWVDPLKEAKALEIMRDRGWTSDSHIVRERGESFNEVVDQIRRDQDYLQTIGIQNDPED